MVTHLDLFSGIGGTTLASHWAGFSTTQFVERDSYCQAVLAKNFPGVPIHDDVKTFNAKPFRGRVTLLSGGFPCQDISTANRTGKGVDGERSGLYREVIRIADECRPDWILLENVHQLIHRGLDRVLADLDSAGYTGRPLVLSSATTGAAHKRKRLWVVAHTDKDSQFTGLFNDEAPMLQEPPRHLWGHVGAVDVRGHDGIPAGVDKFRRRRLQALGNAVSPTQAFPILKAIAELATRPQGEK